MAPPDPAAGSSRAEGVAYVLGTFPQASQTFIAREIRGLLASGMALSIYALRRRAPDALEPPDRAWFGRTRFVPGPLSPSVARANLGLLRRDPRRYFRTLLSLVALPHRPRRFALRAAVLFWRAAWIAVAMERDGGALVHAHFALAQTEVAMAVSGLLGRPFSFTAHARDIYAVPSALREKMRAARVVVTCTGYNAAHLRALCPDLAPEKVRLVHHGVDTAAFAPDPGLVPEESPLLLAAGRLVEKKGFDDLVAACALLRDRGLRFACRIAGDGPLLGPLRDRVRRERLGGRVELLGWLDAPDLARMFPRARAFVLPSRITGGGDRDGIPNVVLEAMAAARAVVSTAVSGIPEAVVDGRTGLLVAPGDPRALADALARVLADAGLAARLGAAGRARVVERFDLERNGAALAAVFGEVSGGGTGIGGC